MSKEEIRYWVRLLGLRAARCHKLLEAKQGERKTLCSSRPVDQNAKHRHPRMRKRRLQKYRLYRELYGEARRTFERQWMFLRGAKISAKIIGSEPEEFLQNIYASINQRALQKRE